MSQQPVELILMRHLASRLAVPVLVVDAAGDMVYFNEPAEPLVGRPFDEMRSWPFDEWTTSFRPEVDGLPLPVDELPAVIALRRAIPAHRGFEYVDPDGIARSIEASAFPIIGSDGRLIGAVSMFWEVSEP